MHACSFHKLEHVCSSCCERFLATMEVGASSISAAQLHSFGFNHLERLMYVRPLFMGVLLHTLGTAKHGCCAFGPCALG
jgi:hypothetical protein